MAHNPWWAGPATSLKGGYSIKAGSNTPTFNIICRSPSVMTVRQQARTRYKARSMRSPSRASTLAVETRRMMRIRSIMLGHEQDWIDFRHCIRVTRKSSAKKHLIPPRQRNSTGDAADMMIMALSASTLKAPITPVAPAGRSSR